MKLKEIPGTLGFLASDDGRIFGPDGIEKNTYFNGDGYITAAVLTEAGVWVTFGVHRLVALAHLPTKEDTRVLTVNHKDLDKCNNCVENLEWVSVGANNVHAALMNTSGLRPTILAQAKDGNTSPMFIQNLAAAAELFGDTVDSIWEDMQKGWDTCGWYLKHHGSKDPIPEVLHKPTIRLRDQRGRQPEQGVKLKNIKEDGEVLVFSSLNDAARHFKVGASHIHQAMDRSNGYRVFKGRYLIVRSTESFPSLSDKRRLELLGRGNKEVVAYCLTSKQYFIYPSASSFIQAQGLSKKAVTVRLRKGQLTEVGGWLFAYMTDENAKKFKELIGSPVP